MRICFITGKYPTKDYPVNTFLDKLVCEMADQGVECTVIAPYRPFIERLKGNNYKTPFYRERITPRGNVVKIYSPRCIWTSNKTVAGINMAKIGLKKFIKCAHRVIRKQNIEFDAVYGHFIYPSGYAAAQIGKIYNKPSFFAYGESSFDIVTKCFTEEQTREGLKTISGVIAVSSKNRDELLAHRIVEPQRIRVFPNAIDNGLFRPIDKAAVRDKLGIGRDDFLVAFVGHFIKRKGSLRVSDALKRFDDVKSIFIGAGPEEPDCDNIIYKGRLSHDEIAEYLNVADVFVLPTLAEGCCNAIVEAMACGLPIISSNLPFNDDILDESNSIRIDPNSVDEIVAAIRELKDNKEKRECMSKASLALASDLTIDQRAQRILSFIEESRNICLCQADK